VSVVAPPRPPDADERSLDERVAALEALFEEARRRARRRRRRNAAVVLLVVIAGLAATYAGGGGVRLGSARSADSSSPRPAANLQNVGRWSVPYGPSSGADRVIVDPKNPANVYAVAGGRVFWSTDGGRSWTGGQQIDPRIDALALDPQRPSVLYAGTGAGVFKSTDAGRSWAWSGLGQTPRLPGGRRGEGNVSSLVVDPTDSSVIYAVAGVVGAHVSKSNDGGRTWRTLPASPRSVDALAIDPANPQVLFAAVEGAWTQPKGPGHSTVAMTSDGGATWRTVLSHDGYFWAIAVDPAGPGTVYAVGTAGVLATADDGLTWTSAGKAPAYNLLALAVDPRNPGTLYVASWKNGVFRTSNGGRTWTTVGATFSGPIAIDPQAPSTLYLGTTDGIAKTLDGGKTWRPADAGIVASDVLSTATDPRDEKVLYVGTYRGLFRSGDRGRTWKALKLGVSTQAIAVDPANSAHLLASGSRGILVSTNSGRTWSNAAGSTTDQARFSSRATGQVSAIVFDPHHPRTVFAAEWGAGVIRSSDGGLTWRQEARRPAWISTIAVDPLGSGTLYTNMNGGLLRSSDGGSSWKWHFFPIGAVMGVLAIDPSDPQTLYASIGDASSRLRPPHLAVSVDGGKHWRFLKSGTHFIDATAVAIEPRVQNTIYAATRFQGVLRTTDGGATWRPFNTGLLARAISTLALDRSGTWLYAGTNGAGVVRVRLH
jgi:photosystem II stability/assembly factor-like uncharacterized protein